MRCLFFFSFQGGAFNLKFSVSLFLTSLFGQLCAVLQSQDDDVLTFMAESDDNNDDEINFQEFLYVIPSPLVCVCV